MGVTLFTLMVWGANSVSAQISGPSGFNWYNNDPTTVYNQYAAYATALPANSYMRPFTPWTPPADYPQYEALFFSAIVCMVPISGPPIQLPLYPGYTIYIYDDHTPLFGNYVSDLAANTEYMKRYRFDYPYTDSVQITALLGTIKYLGGTGDLILPAYLARFDLAEATDTDPPGPLRLQAGVRYWFAIEGSGQDQNYGILALARTNLNLIPSPEPNPPITFEMTPAQCANWGRPHPCQFRVANQDFYRIGEPLGEQEFCVHSESPVNTYNSAYEPHLPAPDCLSPSPGSRPCCLRGFGGRWAVGLDVAPLSLTRGDANCDGTTNGLDIDPFVLAVLDPVGYAVEYPMCLLGNADTNADALVNYSDIDSFVVCVLSTGCP